MNAKRKGSRNERRIMALLEAAGYACTRAAASLGAWDRKRYVGWTVAQLLDRLAQVGVIVEFECSGNPIPAGPANG